MFLILHVLCKSNCSLCPWHKKNSIKPIYERGQTHTTSLSPPPCAFPFQLFCCSHFLYFYPSLFLPSMCFVTSVATDLNCDNYTICPGAYTFSYSMDNRGFQIVLRLWNSGAISVLSIRLHDTDTDNFIFIYRFASKWRILSKFNVQESVHRKYIQIHIQQDATLHSLFISGKLLYMFRMVSPPKIRSTQLYLQHLVHVKPLLLPAAIV